MTRIIFAGATIMALILFTHVHLVYSIGFVVIACAALLED